jgi:uncharacterized membrane protein YfcA
VSGIPLDLTGLQWVFAVLSALCVGFSKAGFGAFAILGILCMAQILPPRESTGVILPMLILADVFAVRAFSRHLVREHLWKLLPPTVVGIAIGWLGMPIIPNGAFGPVIGWILVGLLAISILQKTSSSGSLARSPGTLATSLLGLLAGVSTMLANSAGSVVAVYLLACRLPKYEFVGTAAWFFFIANLVKVPFSAQMGLITADTLHFNLMLAPAVLAGLWIGRILLEKMPQSAFDWTLIVLSLLGSLRLAVGF